MKSDKIFAFYSKSLKKRAFFPYDGQFELTYRCNLNCVHCYCKGLEDEAGELTTDEAKSILDEINREGCVWLALTGGEPLLREDFLEIYSYAKEKGFIITILTNGQLFNRKIIEHLIKSPPYIIELTLNGITRDTYEGITRLEGSFSAAMRNIKMLVKKRLPVVIKTNLMKQNKNEALKIKRWVEETVGRPRGEHYFKYDPIIYPRLNGDKTPAGFRLSFEEIMDIIRQDEDMRRQFRSELCKDFPEFQREKEYLYSCDCWMNQFYIDPFGRLKFCLFSKDNSIDLKKTPFREGFYEAFPRIIEEKFKTASRCRGCRLRQMCYSCPPRAYLERGDREKPVPYYCGFAKSMARETYGAREEAFKDEGRALR